MAAPRENAHPGIRRRNQEVPSLESGRRAGGNRVHFRILSGDLVGIPSSLVSEDPHSPLVIVRICLGGGEELGRTKPKQGRTPIWNELLDVWIPSAAQVFGVPASTSLIIEIILNNDQETVIATTALSIVDDILDTSSAINDPSFGKELVLSEPVPNGKNVARIVVKINNSTDHKGKISKLSPILSPSRNIGRSRGIDTKTLKSDSETYLEHLRASLAKKSALEAARIEEERAKSEKLRRLAAKRRRRRLSGKRKSVKNQLPPGPASYGSMQSSLKLSGGRFSTAKPKSFLDWSAYFGSQIPSPQDYGFGDRRPVTSGGRFNTSKPKSEIDWVHYHSSQLPGPFEYAQDTGAPRKLPGGGKISEARPKSNLDWVVYHSRDIPAPNAYAAPKASRINGGRFSNAYPKSEIDWVIYRSAQIPSPNEYGDVRRPSTSGGRFNTSKPKSQLDWVTYFAKRLPGAADYNLPEGASSDYFTVTVNQSRPPGLQKPLYGSGVGSVRFPAGGGHSREGRWKAVPGGQRWIEGSHGKSSRKSKMRRRRKHKKGKSSKMESLTL